MCVYVCVYVCVCVCVCMCVCVCVGQVYTVCVPLNQPSGDTATHTKCAVSGEDSISCTTDPLYGNTTCTYRVVVKRNTSTEDTCNNIQRKITESTDSSVHKISGLYKHAHLNIKFHFKQAHVRPFPSTLEY